VSWLAEGEYGVSFVAVVEWISKAVEAVGVVVIVVGLTLATVRYLRLHRVQSSPPAFKAYRQALARSILLGLEFLVAADIIRTVATDLSYDSLGALAIIVAIRTFLSVELEMEIEGRWPWQTSAES